jgi:hypothetical protein
MAPGEAPLAHRPPQPTRKVGLDETPLVAQWRGSDWGGRTATATLAATGGFFVSTAGGGREGRAPGAGAATTPAASIAGNGGATATATQAGDPAAQGRRSGIGGQRNAGNFAGGGRVAEGADVPAAKVGGDNGRLGRTPDRGRCSRRTCSASTLSSAGCRGRRQRGNDVGGRLSFGAATGNVDGRRIRISMSDPRG